MITIANDATSSESSMAVLEAFRRLGTFAIRPMTEDSAWVTTRWPNEKYL